LFYKWKAVPLPKVHADIARSHKVIMDAILKEFVIGEPVSVDGLSDADLGLD
jgi:hypothetical protein